MVKRVFDIVVSGMAILVLLPLMLVLAVVVSLESSGPPLFVQIRVGKSFRPFRLFKFRSMTHGQLGTEITFRKDARITRVGAILRRSKLDELPQLWNVFCGDMSFVGPRPELPNFVEQCRAEYEEILKVRPGITDPASIRYRSEADILDRMPDPISYYVQVILPDKLRISKAYVNSANFTNDIALIWQTLAVIFKE